MNRYALLLAAMLLAGAAPVEAGSWIFQRSYYSHHPATPVQVGPAPVQAPLYTRPRGEFTRQGFRNVRSTIVIGNSYDHALFSESWIQVGGQF